MADSSNSPPPVREALDDVIGTSRTLVMQRLDLLQLEAERLVEDAATRMGEASVALVLSALALLTGTVGLIAWGEPHVGLAASSGAVAGFYAIVAFFLGRAAKNRRSTRRREKTS